MNPIAEVIQTIVWKHVVKFTRPLTEPRLSKISGAEFPFGARNVDRYPLLFHVEVNREENGTCIKEKRYIYVSDCFTVNRLC